jgi:hypothetical protein
MKKRITIVTIFLYALQAQAQVVTMQVDTAQLFRFKAELGLERAVKEKLIEYKGTRCYTEQGSKWTINKGKAFVNFGGYDWPILRTEGNRIIYSSGQEEFCIFMMKNGEDGRDMVFLLGPEKDGYIEGGFGYPKNIRGLEFFISD